MNDSYQFFGNDLLVSATGDLLPIDGSTKGQQRILRRLLTNPGDYLWQPTYGAGLGVYIGKITDMRKIVALIRGQILLEAAVAKNPEPVISAAPIANGIAVKISYNDAASGAPQVLSFNASA